MKCVGLGRDRMTYSLLMV